MLSRILLVLLLCGASLAQQPELPPRDTRAETLVDLNTPRAFAQQSSGAEWREEAERIRRNVLVSCGLWPLPEKTPLNAKVFGKIEREGYSVEKVYFETVPGFFLAGNLYRPLGKGEGPFPGILNPHGHWAKGRLADEETGSIAARCIQFARMGMVAFSYDMIGYNDTMQLEHRRSLIAQTNLLWNISEFAMQTWNSIRALDFLESLPDVDRLRLACTGESGGGTQTFILGAIDPRLAAQAPIVMVSHSMQGGCVCENAPLLRIQQSNMEIAAVPAPRPQIIVAATGDWTKNTMTVEGPAIASVYALMDAPGAFHRAIFEAPHNYNKATREVVYGWFNRWLLDAPHADPISEQPYTKEPDEALRVFPDGKMPEGAINEQELVRLLVSRSREMWTERAPETLEDLQRYRNSYGPVWEQVLQVTAPRRRDMIIERKTPVRHSRFFSTRVAFGRKDAGDRVEGIYYSPISGRKQAILLIHPEGVRAYHNASDEPQGLAADLVQKGFPVFAIQPFSTGGAESKQRNYFTNFFTTYNRTDLQERVQDVATAIAVVKSVLGRDQVYLAGEGRAGLWALLAAPFADGVIADCADIGSVSDEELLSQDLFAPGLRLFNDFEGAALLAGPRPILLHNTGEGFSAARLESMSKAAGTPFRLVERAESAEALVTWLSENAR